jgi:hypothetical protein
MRHRQAAARGLSSAMTLATTFKSLRAGRPCSLQRLNPHETLPVQRSQYDPLCPHQTRGFRNCGWRALAYIVAFTCGTGFDVDNPHTFPFQWPSARTLSRCFTPPSSFECANSVYNAQEVCVLVVSIDVIPIASTPKRCICSWLIWSSRAF